MKLGFSKIALHARILAKKENFLILCKNYKMFSLLDETENNAKMLKLFPNLIKLTKKLV